MSYFSISTFFWSSITCERTESTMQTITMTPKKTRSKQQLQPLMEDKVLQEIQSRIITSHGHRKTKAQPQMEDHTLHEIQRRMSLKVAMSREEVDGIRKMIESTADDVEDLENTFPTASKTFLDTPTSVSRDLKRGPLRTTYLKKPSHLLFQTEHLQTCPKSLELCKRGTSKGFEIKRESPPPKIDKANKVQVSLAKSREGAMVPAIQSLISLYYFVLYRFLRYARKQNLSTFEPTKNRREQKYVDTKSSRLGLCGKVRLCTAVTVMELFRKGRNA